MPNTIFVNGLSHYTTIIKMGVLETDTELAIGTGFYYEDDEYYYLITNGHNVTGVNPETNTRMSQHAAFPTYIEISYRVVNPAESLEMMVYNFHKIKMPLYEDEDCLIPVWFVHPMHGYNVDVVAIPLFKKGESTSTSEYWWSKSSMTVNAIKAMIYYNMTPSFAINSYADFQAEPEIADNVYILGYPFGITDPLQLPIWKRGSIATEPNVAYKNLPMMLIDTATRQGMSGAPVIIMRSGVHFVKNGAATETKVGILQGFAGIYSGRYGDGFDAQLGIVWRKEVITEIISAKTKGSVDFQRI